MTDQHPITPPPELVQQWVNQFVGNQECMPEQVYIARAAAQWGADMELEACCLWLNGGSLLRAARRPKPLSLTQQALEAWERQMNCYEETDPDMNTIRLALERLQELEGGN